MGNWQISEMRKPPIRASELTEEHYKALYYFSKVEYPKVIYGSEILYKNPPYINRELKEAGLIEESEKIKGLYTVTPLGTEILRLYPTWKSLVRRVDTSSATKLFVEVNKDMLKRTQRKE